jgi:hypothetical protein
MGQRALGRLLDIGTGWAPVDLDTADGATGKRISMMDCAGITVVLFAGTGPAAGVLHFTQHTLYASGTTADLVSTAVATSQGITAWHYKSELALDNDETWVKVTQTESHEVDYGTNVNGLFEKIVSVYVDADQLGDGYTHLSVNAVSTNGTPCLAGLLYIKHDLKSQRTPANLPNLLRPGAANA